MWIILDNWLCFPLWWWWWWRCRNNWR